MASSDKMPHSLTPRRFLFRRLLGPLVVSCALVAPGAAEEPVESLVAGPAVPQDPIKKESSRRAEIRRMLGPTGDGYVPASTSDRRRSISREELDRLREDIRANRDVYEVRERAGRARH